MAIAKSEDSAVYDICISILNYNSEDRTIFLLDHIVEMVAAECKSFDLSYAFVIRDNSPSNSRRLKASIDTLRLQGYNVFPESSPNAGFGGGHNLNFAAVPSSVFIVMNNDMAFPHVDWLIDTYKRLRTDSKVGAIGLEQENFKLNPDFGFASRAFANQARMYLDGSLLCIRSDIYKIFGGFDESYGLAYFEDTDLSFRLRASGYRLETADIPHQHFRSSSTVKAPPSFYSALYEKGRSVFFSRWAEVLDGGVCNDSILIKCDHDGIGDFFLSIFPLRAFIKAAIAGCFSVTVYLRHGDLAFLLADLEGLEISTAPIHAVSRFGRIISLSAINMALPESSIELYAAQLGLSSFEKDPAPLFELLEHGRLERHSQILQPADEGYVVCHFDNTRKGFHGRVLGRTAAKEILSFVVGTGRKVVLVGATDDADLVDQNYEAYVATCQGVSDLRGRTDLSDLIRIISQAESFIGIDSGPANMAQAFNVTSFLVFGSTMPETKIYRSNISIYMNASLSCLGCYHTNVEYAYATCQRNDEACVKDINIPELLSALKTYFLAPVHVQLPSEAYLARRRECLMRLMYNPVFKSRAYTQSGFHGKGFADAIIEVVDVIGKRASVDNSNVNEIAHRLENDNLKLRQTVKKYDDLFKLLSADLSIRLNPSDTDKPGAKLDGTFDSVTRLASFDMASVLPSRGGLSGCTLSFVEGKVVMDCVHADPQIMLRPIRLLADDVLIEINASADQFTQFKVYWSIGTPVFTEDQAGTFSIGPTLKSFSYKMTAAKGSTLYIRIDPAETRTVVTSVFGLYGHYKPVRSLRLLPLR